MKTLIVFLLALSSPSAFSKIDKTWNAHAGGVWKVNVSPEGLFFMSAGEDGKVRAWWMDCLCTLTQFSHGSNRKIYDAAFLPGRRSVSTSHDGSIFVWNTETGESIKRLEGHDEYVGRLAVSWDSKKFFTAGADDKVIEWDADTLTEVGRYLTKSPVGVVESIDSDKLFTIGLHGLIEWKRSSKTVVSTILETPYVFAAAQSGESFFIAGGTASGLPVQRRDRKTGAAITTYLGAKRSVWGLAVSPDGRWVGVSELNGPIIVWDVASSEMVYRSDAEIPETLSLAFTPEGRGLIVGDTAGKLHAVRF